MNAPGFAIRMMVAQAVLFAAETAAIHHIGTRASIMQLALMRAAGGVALALLFGRGLAVLRTRLLRLQLLRGVVSLIYLWVLVYSFTAMPFADATAISYTLTGYIALFSLLILREPVTRRQWVAAGLVLVGALLIAKPAFAGWNFAYLIVLLGTGFNGLAFVLNRYLQREDSEATTMFYTNLVPLIGNLPALWLANPPSVEIMLWLPGVILLGPLGMLAGIVAVRHASAAMLAPYTLLRLVIALVGAVIIFQELPDLLSALGAGIILGSCLLSSGALQLPHFRRRLAIAHRIAALRSPVP
jgi:drug/metabolite transporter (DMT)-like permease